MTNPDVLVVGGGPAGSTVAGLLAGAGRRVLVVDRARFPRPKPCGECLNPGAVEALERLGLLERVQALAPAKLRGWRLRGSGVEAAAGFGGAVTAMGIARDVLDAALLEAARDRGADVLEETRVERVEAARRGGSPVVHLCDADGGRHTLQPGVVVGADGLRSVVSRSLGLVRRTPRLRKVSLTFHVRRSPAFGPDDARAGRGNAGEGVLDTRDGITLGTAPIRADGTLWNATVVADARRHGRQVATDPEGFFRRVAAHRGLALGEITGGPWASGPFDWPLRRCWAPGVVLVGDAAGYYDPFTGQGIYRALRSAELAAEAVARVLEQPSRDWAPLAAYSVTWRRETRPSVWVQRAVEAVLAHAALARPVLRRLRASGGLARVIRVTGDVAAPVTLLNPAVWLGRGH